MATKILMPQLGESVTEGTITKWLVKVGDRVEKYSPLCEVITDKVNAEVPSTVTGIVDEILAAEDETVKVGTVICLIREESSQEATELANDVQTIANDVSLQPSENDRSMKQRYSPAVLRLANEHNIDLTLIQGTGLDGRVTRKDVMRYIEGKQTQGVTPSQSPKVASVEKTEEVSKAERPIVQSVPPSIVPTFGDTEIPVTPVRRAIAQRMTQSKHEAPHAWMMVEVDVTELVNYRQKIKDDFKKKEGITLTYLPFFIKAVVDSLKEYPMLNSQWAGDKIILKKEINISIAVATDDALFVPVIKKADEKSIVGLTRSIDELVRKTRKGKLTQDDITGGTFTVNNTGSFGSILSTPIINYPQAAILSVEAIVKRPVIYNNMIAIRDMVNLCLSIDHRILDGLVAGKFLQSVKYKLENMTSLTM